MLATSKESAVTGGKSKTRKSASPFSYPLSSPFFPHPFYLTFCFPSPPLLEAICFSVFGLQMPLRRNTLCWSWHMLDLYWTYVLGWAQPCALKGVARAWHVKAHALYIPVLETQKDSMSSHLSLGSGRELLNASLCKFGVTLLEMGAALVYVKGSFCSLSHGLGLSKGREKEENTPTASTPFF